MEKLNKSVLSKLLNVSAPAVVTIYVPTHMSAAPPHISENQIRLKNLVHKAAAELEAGRHYDRAKELTGQLGKLHNDLNFWKEQTPGILLCAVPGQVEMYHLPVDTEEYVAVDDHFHLAPLMGLISDDRHFYILELAEHNPELLKGDMYGLTKCDIDLPANIKQAEQENRTEKANGHGYPGRFFRIIDDIVYEKVDHSLPLILSGTDTETAEYRHLSHYPKILKREVHHNSLRMEPKQLFNETQAIIQAEIIEPEHQSAIEEYLRFEQANPAVIARDEDSLLQAAEQGRIDKLLTVMRRQTTDNVQDSLRPTTRITFLEPQLDNLLNKLAPKVYQMKGVILNLLPTEMPAGQTLAAKLRY